MKRNKRGLIITTSALALSLSLGAVSFAESNFKNLQAWFGNTKVYMDNQQVQLSAQPFIVDGTTYLPLRAIAEDVFNANVGWDPATSSIYLSQKPDENAAYLTHQLLEKQMQVTELEKKTAELEAKIKELESQKTTSTSDLRDLENYLNKQHDTYKNIEFDIVVSKGKSKDEIDVKITTNMDKYSSKWDYLSDNEVKKYLQNIVDDILYDYKNADVVGYVADSSRYTSKDLATFYTTSSGNVVLKDRYNGKDSGKGNYTLSELKSYLNRNHDTYDGVRFTIDLYEDSYGDIVVDLSVKENDWTWLTLSEKEDYLEKLYKEITWEYPKADVYGDVYDGNYKLNNFDFTSNGYANIR